MGVFIEGGPYVRKYGIQKLELEVVKNLKRYMTSFMFRGPRARGKK